MANTTLITAAPQRFPCPTEDASAALRVVQTGARVASLDVPCGSAPCFAWLTDEDGGMLTGMREMQNRTELLWSIGHDPDALTGHVAYETAAGHCIQMRSDRPVTTWRGLVSRYSSSNRNANHDEDADAATAALMPRLNVSLDARSARACVESVPLATPFHFLYIRASGLLLSYHEAGAARAAATTARQSSFSLCATARLPAETLSLRACAALANTLRCTDAVSLAPFRAAATESAAISAGTLRHLSLIHI